MKVGYVVVALVSAVVAVFALQNGMPTSVKLFGWSLDGVPLAGLVLAALTAGLIVAGVPLLVSSRRWRSRARSLEARVEMLERAVADRDRAALQKRASAP